MNSYNQQNLNVTSIKKSMFYIYYS